LKITISKNAFQENIKIYLLLKDFVRIQDLNHKGLEVLSKITPEFRTPDVENSMRSIISQIKELKNRITGLTNKQIQNNLILEKLPNLLNPAINSINARRDQFEREVQEIELKFTTNVKRFNWAAKILIFIISAGLYLVTEYHSETLEEKFKPYKTIFHIILFSLGFFFVDPISDKIKEYVKKKAYFKLNSKLKNNFLDIENSIRQKCLENGIQYSNVPQLIDKVKYFTEFIKIAKEQLK
jgi:hypothetical protein